MATTTISVPMLLWVLTPIVMAGVINAWLFKVGWNAEAAEGGQPSPYIPPGWVVGSIWTVIFGLLGFVAYTVRDTMLRGMIIGFWVFALGYPFFTRLRNGGFARMLNAVTLIWGFLIAIVVLLGDRVDMVAYVVPLVLWGSYVNLIDSL